jgi:hypothetical protein
MPSLQDTAYPRLKHNVTDKELAIIYTPALNELSLAEQHTKGSSAKLSFLTQCLLQFLFTNQLLHLVGR